MMNRIFILKNPSTKIKIYSEYMVVTSATNNDVIAFRYVNELYINKTIYITPSHLIKLASLFKVYFIDHHGYVLASIKLEK